MADEPEVIRHQMEETRASLTEKLESLENQVVGTVQDATAAVAETVENVKEAVQDTMDTVTDSVRGTVASVKDTFDIPRQVDRHPWLMVGGSAVLGFVCGRLVGRMGGASGSGLPHYPAYSPMSPIRPAGQYDSNGPGAYTAPEPPRPKEAAPAEPGWLDTVGETFGGEIAKLKGMAIGTALGVVRDMIRRAVPEQLSVQLADVVDNVTRKLGGQPLQGPVLGEDDGPGRTAGNGREKAGFAEAGRAGSVPKL